MYELITALRLAWADQAVQSVILTGAGEKAFCTGGDVKQRAETGDYGPSPSASPKTAEKYVPLITSGLGIVGIALSESHAGSDAGNPRMTARRTDDG